MESKSGEIIRNDGHYTSVSVQTALYFSGQTVMYYICNRIMTVWNVLFIFQMFRHRSFLILVNIIWHAPQLGEHVCAVKMSWTRLFNLFLLTLVSGFFFAFLVSLVWGGFRRLKWFHFCVKMFFDENICKSIFMCNEVYFKEIYSFHVVWYYFVLF